MSSKGQDAPKTEGVAKTKADDAVETKVKVKELVAPKQRVVIGEIDSFSKKLANADVGGKFEEDTYIVSISSMGKGEDGNVDFKNNTVFLSAKQYNNFDMKHILFLGNTVKVLVEDRIEGVTGYKDNQEDDFLTPHKSTKPAFVNATQATDSELIVLFSSLGLPFQSISYLVDKANDRRKTKVMLSEAIEKPF